MPQLIRKRIILSKLESSYGAVTNLIADDSIEISEPEITPLESDDVERTVTREYLGSNLMLLAGKRVSTTFKCEFKGSGTKGKAPDYDVLLKACGFASKTTANTSVVYTPVSEAFASAALWFHADGNIHKLSGARGTVTLETSADQLAYLSFTFTGLFNAVVSGNAPAGITPNPVVPVIAEKGNVTYSLHGYNSAPLSALSIDLGNEVNYVAYQTSQQVQITDRKTSGSVTLESPDLASKNYFTIASGSTTGALSYELGKTGGNIVKVEGPKVQIGKPSYGDISGIQALELPLTLIPDDGDDELTITVK